MVLGSKGYMYLYARSEVVLKSICCIFIINKNFLYLQNLHKKMIQQVYIYVYLSIYISYIYTHTRYDKAFVLSFRVFGAERMHTKMVIQSLGCCPSKRNINFVSGAHNIKRGLFLKFLCFFWAHQEFFASFVRVFCFRYAKKPLEDQEKKHVRSAHSFGTTPKGCLLFIWQTSMLVKYVSSEKPEECAIFFWKGSCE